MDFTSSACKIDALKSLQYCAFMRNKHLSKLRSPYHIQPFWLETKFQKWKSTQTSSLIIVKGSYTSRFEVKDFCVNAIDLLRGSKIPVIWALKTIEDDTKAPSIIDVLKDLITQALRLNIVMQNERSLAVSCVRFRGADTETEWLDLLGSVLVGLRLVYIVVDMEAVISRYTGSSASSAFSWPSAFLGLFQKMSANNMKTDIKVVLVSYGSPLPQETGSISWRDLITPVGCSQAAPVITRGQVSSRQRGFTFTSRYYGRSRRRGSLF